jgi:long-chain acyl-CoA synthetase
MMVYFALAIGMGVNYCANPLKVINYLSVVNPTIMASVPRILDLIYSNVQRQLAQSKKHKQAIFHWAIAIGDKVSRLANEEKNVPLLLQLQHRLADRLVLKKLRRITGEKMRMLCCAGAPLPEKIHRFFNACGVFIIYGYGLTEAFATVSCFKLSHNVHGTVGYPLDCLEVKIAENGEILFKGPTIMVGYYNKPKETAAAFDNGWLKTGDGGYLRDDGNIVLTDRLKDLMRTPAGLYVAPQMLESIFCKDTYIAQIVVIGDGRNYLTALIVPDFSQLNVYATNAGLDTSDSAKLLQEPKILDLYTARIEELNKDLALHEKIKRFTLLPQEFSQDKGELTITLKARRKVINEHYRDIIEAMYR